ncbi:hypothetical protein [Burkholderia sp. Tr-20390]|uniref:hypothetical protein n=1 Tax=Burkholderia sp. Tr-20390 TaxID=2703904 RepID=UPI0019818115|nr:hypothetical protein [Burkholderia sp. Tr-20390]MBN3734643.1 hypothetical protein [Burkholderia sp. Tr-20390]
MNFREQLHKARFGPICNIGGSDSNSQSASTTNNIDQRLNADNGATGTSVSGTNNTVNVQAVDHGAVTQAFGLGNHAIDAVLQEGTGAQSAVQQTAAMAINGVLTDAAGTRDAYAKASDQVASAYKDLGSLLDGTFSAATSQVAGAYQNANSAITAAYQDTKTGNQRTLMIGALIVVALAVSMPFLAKEAA